jgi:hypothetical protein
MFGLPGELTVAIPAAPRFCSLYADGPFTRRRLDRESGASFFACPRGAAVALYYTYPTHRAAALVRNDDNALGLAAFPGLSKKTRPLIQTRSSGVDRLRRALARLNEKHGGAFSFSDDFYTRLAFLVNRPGKLDYVALDTLAERFLSQSFF